MTSSTAVTDAFERAKHEFRVHFDSSNYDFSNYSSIEDVYKATDQIQQEHARTGTMRNLAKIQPFLEGLRRYEEVIKTFVQVEPEILALIWGPISFALLISSTYMRTFDSLLNVISQIGAELPAFQKYADLFCSNSQIQHVLCLFYRDILDFHATVLSLLKHKQWSIFFESIWPKYAGKIKTIQENITKHQLLLHGEVTLANITEAHAARAHALQKYEEDQAFQQRQVFETVRNSLAPQLYYETLELLTEKCAMESGNWLTGHSQYEKWFDASDKSTTRLLWLEGIPGAGKTCLASIIIRHLQLRKNPLAFAFLTHREKTSPCKVLQSFAFQIALDNKDVQPALVLAYDQDYLKLNSSVEFMTGVLKDLLAGQTTTYIVLDGLDEMLSPERQTLVKAVLDLHQELESVKVLMCSRAEHDISLLLHDKAERLRVHEANGEAIQAYVRKKAQMFTSSLPVDQQTKDEIRKLMTPIGSQANGMFLYARLLCDSVAHLGDLDAVREAVDNLPNGLQEAYERILSRIDQGLSQREREEARTILALIACSGVPLSKTEIQLAVFTSQGSDPSRGCRGLFLNLLQRCGPVIEEVRGFVYFVHFSLEEFLFSEQSAPGGYLNCPAVNSSFASICLRYLCSRCFEANLSQEELRQYLISGAYVLEGYACLYWLQHTRRSDAANDALLRDDLRGLLTYRRNDDFAGGLDPATNEFGRFKDEEPEIFDNLVQTDAFSRKRWREFELSRSELKNWGHFDPFTFSHSQLEIRETLESMTCEPKRCSDSCHCSSLKKLYGELLYKCGRYGCPFYRIGFNTKAQRNRHMKAHSRPYKCDQEGCIYFDLGFRTHALLSAHFQKHHTTNHLQKAARLKEPGEDELKFILDDAVKANDLDTLQALRERVREFSGNLLLTAVKQRCSAPILEFLMPETQLSKTHNCHGKWVGTNLFVSAALQGNLEVFRYFLPRNPFFHLVDTEVAKVIGETRSADLVELVSSSIKNCKARMLTSLHREWKSVDEESKALQCLHRLGNAIPVKILNRLIRDLGPRCFSIPIAEFYLNQGADVDGGAKLTTTPSGATELSVQSPLFAVSKRTSLEAMRFMVFLLEKGANANVSFKGTRIDDRPGPKMALETIGKSWDELVAQAQSRVMESTPTNLVSHR